MATLRDIWDGIREKPGRIGLSFFAISVGIASLTVLIAVLSGLRAKSDQLIAELGVNVFGILQQSEKAEDLQKSLNDRHVRLLVEHLPFIQLSTVQRFNVPTPGTDERISVIATDQNLFKVRQWEVIAGRFFDPVEILSHERHAVVSQNLSQEWNWGIGDIIILLDSPYKIIGIVKTGGSVLDIELSDSDLMPGNRVVFVPKSVPFSWLNETSERKNGLDAIFVRVPDELNFPRVINLAHRLISQPDYKVNRLSWITAETLLRGVNTLKRTVKLTAGSIAILCLLLGGTTLMSLMISNVRDRIGEIGLRRALGASISEISSLFVLEACLVTAGAALTAITGSLLFILLWGHHFPVPVRLGPVSIAVPLTVSFLVAAISSFWPAKLAAGIMPSQALRNE